MKTSADYAIPQKVPGVFTRSLQRISEQISSTEKTPYSQEVLMLFNELESLLSWCTRVMSQLQSLAEPNPTYRFSNTFKTLVTKHKDSPEERIQQNPEYQFSVALEQGLSLIALTDAGSSNDLQEISNLESQLAKLRYNFKQAVEISVIVDVRRLLSELDKLADHRKYLESKRLDLDFAKRRLKNVNTSSTSVDAATRTQEEAQNVFDSAVEDFIGQARQKLSNHKCDLADISRKLASVQKQNSKDCLSACQSALQACMNDSSSGRAAHSNSKVPAVNSNSFVI